MLLLYAFVSTFADMLYGFWIPSFLLFQSPRRLMLDLLVEEC